MNGHRRITVVAATCLMVSMSASILLLRHIDEIRPNATLEDALYISSPKIVKRASLGFDGLMACIYWTRAVQYFGQRLADQSYSYNELAPLLDITTALDPHLLPAYQFGASFLAPHPPLGAGKPDRAIQLMEYGIAHNPDNWHLYSDLGFVYYTELKDYKRAAQIFAEGSKVPHAHPFLKIIAAQTAQHAGDLNTARMLWTATLESSRQSDIRRNALEHLRAIKVDEDVTNLQVTVASFAERSRRIPSSMAELAAVQNWPGVPVDPDGNPYELTSDGRILVQNPDNFSFITKGLPPGYKAPPPKFHVKD